jgi:hypothetical protein
VLLVPHYPPAAGLWHYFICVNTIFTEGATFLAQFIMLISPLIVLFKNVKYRQWYWIMGIFFLACFLVTNLGHAIACLYVDHILSAYFGGILFAYLSGRYTHLELLLFFPPLFCLPLIKEVGSFLGIAASLFILFHRLILAIKEHRLSLSRTHLVSAMTVLLVCSASLISIVSWDLRLSSLEIKRFKTKNVSFSDFSNALFGDPTEKQSLIRKRFFELFLSQQMSKSEISYKYNEFYYSIAHLYKDKMRLSVSGWLLLSTFLFCLSFFMTKEKEIKISIIYTFCFMFIVFIAYTVMLLYLYLFIFKHEKMASYVRYYNIVIMPLVLLSMSFLTPAMKVTNSNGRRTKYYAFLAVLVFLYLFETPYFSPLLNPNPRHKIREVLSRPIHKIHSTIDLNKSMYVIFQVKENGFQRIMIHYDLAPVKSKISPFDIHLRSEKEISKIIRNYDYVWCLTCDSNFFFRYKNVFPTQSSGKYRLFRVNRDKGTVTLKPVI